MNLQDFLNSLSKEQLQKLAEAQTAEELPDKARELGLTLNAEDAAAVFAALYPARSGKLSDDALEAISGGILPRPSAPVYCHDENYFWEQLKGSDHL